MCCGIFGSSDNSVFRNASRRTHITQYPVDRVSAFDWGNEHVLVCECASLRHIWHKFTWSTMILGNVESLICIKLCEIRVWCALWNAIKISVVWWCVHGVHIHTLAHKISNKIAQSVKRDGDTASETKYRKRREEKRKHNHFSIFIKVNRI